MKTIAWSVGTHPATPEETTANAVRMDRDGGELQDVSPTPPGVG